MRIFLHLQAPLPRSDNRVHYRNVWKDGDLDDFMLAVGSRPFRRVQFAWLTSLELKLPTVEEVDSLYAALRNNGWQHAADIGAVNQTPEESEDLKRAIFAAVFERGDAS